MSRSVVRRWAKLLLFGACLALLVCMIVQADPQQLLHTLAQLPGTIALCVAVWGVGYLLNAASFRQVLTGLAPSQCPGYAEVLRITVTGYALNYITPFGLLGGEPYRILQLRPALGTERATQGVVLYSMMHIASHFCFWLLSAMAAVYLALLPQGQGLSAMGRTELVSMLALVVVCLGLLWLFWQLYRQGIALRFMRRWVDWPLLNPSLLPPVHFVRALLLELLSRLVNVVEYWLIMQALGFAGFGYLHALLVVAFSSLLANVLFFSPLQMGTREGGILLALQYLHIGASLPVALTLSLATRIREFIWILVGLLFISRKPQGLSHQPSAE